MAKFRVPALVKKFGDYFHSNGFSLYIVGGAVRDYYLGIKNSDYDFATDALPSEVQKIFKRVIPTGIKHGTVTVLFKGASYEVTTFRIDGKYEDLRRPSAITFVSNLEEDLKRRDFTINALAVEVSTGLLIDQHGGLKDLKAGIIRAIGDPYKRFNEDALRIMRGCRLVSQLEFNLEEGTMEAMRSLSVNLKEVSGERIHSELFKILASPKPSLGLRALDACGALAILFPELKAGDKVEQKGFHNQDVLQHNFSACDAAPRSKPIVRLAALLHDIGKAFTKRVDSNAIITFHNHEVVGAELALGVLERLKSSNEEKFRVSNLVRNHMFYYSEEWSDGAVRRFVNRVGLENLEDLFDLRIADQIAIHGKPIPASITALKARITAVLAESNALTVKDLAINGNLLASLGIPRGPVMGEILSALLETVLDDPTQNERDKLLDIAQKLYSAKTIGYHRQGRPKQS